MKTCSNYKGVNWDKSRNKWRSSIFVNGKTKHIGRFSTEIEAYNSIINYTLKNKTYSKINKECIVAEAEIPNSAMVKFRKLTGTKWKAEEGFTLPPADLNMGGLEYYQINGVLINKFKATSD